MDKKPVAEPMGVVAAAIYLIFILVLIPIHLNEWINEAATFSTKYFSILCYSTCYYKIFSYPLSKTIYIYNI